MIHDQIVLHFRAVDDLEGWTEVAETVEEAVSIFNYQMGRMYDIGSSYAVSGDGICTCTIDSDHTWKELGLD